MVPFSLIMTNITKIQDLAFQDIPSIPQLIKDFLDEKIEAFQEDLFRLDRLEDKLKAKKQYFNKEKRKVLHQALTEQLADLTLTSLQIKNLQLLHNENTFTVTTGHQLNLFCGPAYFVYKILQTIRMAEGLQKHFPHYHFVPMFWMATGDHDFEEIKNFKTENGYYEISGKAGGPVGRIQIEDLSFIPEFEKEFKDTPFGVDLIQMLKTAYQKDKTLAQATRSIVQQLFANYGLLMMDGDDVLLKTEMKSTFREELLQQQVFNSSVEKVEFLRKHYGKVQVNPREINLFYVSETRNRIEKHGQHYIIVDTQQKFSEAEILQELEFHPERFSPNALLRPVYQETVLPNLAYIGGNAEAMYWLELKDYFRDIGLPFPFIVPRNSLLFIIEKNVKKLKKAGLLVKDILGDLDELTKHILLDHSEILSEINTNETQLKNSFRNLEAAAESTDITFKNLVQAEQTRQLKSYDKMRKRLLRAEKIKQKEKVNRLENLFSEIHPGHKWQERVLNFSVFYADYGQKWLNACYENIDIEKSEMIIFSI